MKVATPAPAADAAVRVERAMMGGTVAVDVVPGSGGTLGDARRDATRALDRLERWAARVSRFRPRSEINALNDERGRHVRVGPTLAALLLWARTAEAMTDGLVNVRLLDERLAAEGAAPWPGLDRSGGWRVVPVARGARVERHPGRRLDLDGVAKGWLADRAAALLGHHAVAVVDADGDVALRLAPETEARVRIDDPRRPKAVLAELTLAGRDDRRAFGVATSGTSVHRWTVDGGERHHLIDPTTRRPAVTDVVQATCVASTARAAEAFAKAAVIAGTRGAWPVLERPGVLAAILLTDTGDVLATPSATAFL